LTFRYDEKWHNPLTRFDQYFTGLDGSHAPMRGNPFKLRLSQRRQHPLVAQGRHQCPCRRLISHVRSSYFCHRVAHLSEN